MKMCVCDDTRKVDGNACVPRVPGDACEQGSKNCQGISGDLFCDAVTNKCSCASTYTASNGACVQKRCSDDLGCGGIAHIKCINTACTCSVTSELNRTNGLCESKGLGSSCVTDIECGLVTGAMCDNAQPRVCVCGEKYEMNDAECILKQPGVLYLNRVGIFVAQYIEHDEHFATFRCDYRIDHGFYYQIQWYLDGEMINSTDIVDSSKASEASVLKDVELYDLNPMVFQFDSKLRCRVTAFNESGTIAIKIVESNEFTPMKISSRSLTFTRGQSASFTVTLYVPFGCGTHSEDCRLQYLLYDPSDLYDCIDSTIAVLHSDTCGGRIKGSTKTDIETFSLTKHETTITIVAKNNNKYKLKSQFQLKLQTFSDDNLKNLWQGFTTTIAVHVTDGHSIQNSHCYAHVDPHMRTFDGRTYENQNTGEFILVRHKKYPIEVDMITQPCSIGGSKPTCACAVNVRAGGDIFTINHCSGHLTKYLSDKDGVLIVYRESSSQYKIILPTGMSVNIYLTMWGKNYWMNVDIYPSPHDINQVEGLCGNYNGDPEDDFIMRNSGTLLTPSSDNSKRIWPWGVYPDEFSFSWDLTHKWKESLLNPVVYENTLPWNRNQTFCICPGIPANNFQSVCSKHEDDSCNKTVVRRGTLIPGTLFRDKREAASSVKKHRVESHVKQRLNKMTNSWHNKVLHIRNKRESTSDPANMSSEEARAYCSDAFLSCASVQAAKDQIDTDLNKTLEDCAFDMVMTGNSQWVTAHCDAQTQALQMEIQKNETIAKVFPDIVKIVKDNSCPSNCSSNGKCVSGTCQCFDGYGTDLCLIELSKPPQLQELGTKGTCDIGKGDICDCIPIVGDGFVETAICNVTVYETNEKNVFTMSKALSRSCEYNNLNEICAPVQDVKRRRKRSKKTIFATMYQISVSNDAIHFCSPSKVIVLDGTCQDSFVDSAGDTVMILKHGYCYIEGRCVLEATTGDDSCTECKPASATFEWTNVCHGSSKHEKPNMLGIAIGIPVGILVLLGVILVSVLVAKKQMQNRTVQARVDVGLYDSTASNKTLQLREDHDLFTNTVEPMHIDGDGFQLELPEEQGRSPTSASTSRT
ncbi:uncharacterized protein LOC127859566 [Dreissena polymorpha]|uniref:VWFD domain-containing protein n=1 Tax=Dreissena polymorpha TaxID=45954 RepID=A0A9D4BLJ9_DREPO|nr:uncharacterized protein LOC127859566 [Dreissena polymorpha]KAH3700504.1 hypothetical protein DPMN_075483 [Dreissena polymorpha]